MKKLAILASHNGSGFNAIYQATLEKILDIKVEVVISNNTGANVLNSASEKNIDNYVVNSKTDIVPDDKIYDLLKKYDCEYVFLSGYMKKLSSKITNNFQVINSHPSLLPKYGGAGMYGRFVHEAVVQNNEKISGVTLHRVNEVYDDGEIIIQKELILDADETVDSLETKIKALEQLAIVEGLKKCLK